MKPSDQFLVTLPPQVSIIYSDLTPTVNNLSCVFMEPADLQVTSCQSLGPQQFKLIIGEALSDYFQFDVASAVSNPPSTTFTDSIKIETYSEETLLDFQYQDILIASTNDSLAGVSMYGSVSQNAGDRNTLQFTIKTKNPVLPNGMVQVQFPLWFQIAKENIKMIHLDKNNLQCMEMTSKMIISCSFDSKTQTVSLSSLIGSQGKNASEIIQFSIKDVYNPISTDAISLLKVSTTDEFGGAIDQSIVQFRALKPNQITNAKLSADNSLVQETTRYTLQFSIGVPIYQGICSVYLYLPYPDFKLTSTTGVISDVQGIGLFGSLRSYQYQINPNDNSILIKDACSQGYVNPQIPATLYLVGLKNPEVVKLTDPITIKIWNGLNGQIAELTTDKSPRFQITNGKVSQVSLISSSQDLNSEAEITLKFMFQHQAITDGQSTSQYARFEVFFADLDFKATDIMRLQSVTLAGGQVTLEEVLNNKITILVQTPQIKANTIYQIDLTGFILAGSKQTMGDIVIQISRQWYTNDGLSVYYPIDNGTFTGLITTVEGEFLRAEVYPGSQIVFDNTTYRIELQIQNPIPKGGYLQIGIPQEIQIIGDNPNCLKDTSETSCSLQNGSLIITGPFAYSGVSQQDGALIIEITNMKNPRSTRTTGIFTFHSFDQGNQLIDVYAESNTAITMTKPLNFTSAILKQLSSLRVSDEGVSYTFEVTLAMSLGPGDYLTVGVPLTEEIPMPEFPLQNCSSPTQSALICSLSVDKTIKVTLSDPHEAETPLTLNLGSFNNPSSGKRTGPFRLAAFDKDGFSFAITQPDDYIGEQLLSAQMRDPYLIKSGANIRVNTDIPNSPVVITIQFFIKDQIEAGSKLVVNYPEQVGINTSAISVISPQSSSLNGVVLVPELRQIVGKDFFSVYRSPGSYLELQLTGFFNPLTAATSDLFTVDFYTPEGFVIDRLEQTNITLTSRCDFPCKDCSQGPAICDSCLSSELSKFTLLQENQCVQKCKDSYYQIGNICGKCDPSCATCDISPLLCTSCPQQINKFTYLFNNRCVSACDTGYFRNDVDKLCQQCKSPCRSCDTSINSCSTCTSNYYLYRGTCRQQCPEDYFINNATSWQCDRCINNCQTCQRTVDQCTSCLPGYKLNMLNSTCFIGECPEGVTAEESPGICSICKSKCATCSHNSTAECLTCSANLFLTKEKDCVVQCKSNQAIVVFDDGIRRCQSCKDGCAKCLDGKPDVCQTCEPGLVNFKFSECLTECPQDYALNNKSGNCLDGRLQCKFGYALNATDECELTVQECMPGYMLNTVLNRCIPIPGFYVPFPILGGLFIITLIFIVCVRCGKNKSPTKLVPSIIILWSFFELPIFAAQVYLAVDFGHQLNVILTLIAIVMHFPVNYYAVNSILPARLLIQLEEAGNKKTAPKLRRQASNAAGDMDNLDQTFKHWAIDHQSFLRTLRRLALFYNHKFLRCLTCQFNGRPQFLAVFDNPDFNFNRPMLRVAITNITASYLLLSIGDVTALKQIVFWGYQFTVICIESLAFVCLLSLLEILDWYQNSRGMSNNYFKVNATVLKDQNVFGDSEDNTTFKRQKSFENHLNLLKHLNEELEQRKLYSGNFDKLSEYQSNLNDTALKTKQKRKNVQIHTISDHEDEDQSDHQSEGCLSTQNHYGWNKHDFFDFDRRAEADYRDTHSENDLKEKNPNYKEEDWARRPYNSLISETDYGDPQRLFEFREELEGREQENSRTLDYKASFHILDPNPLGLSEGDLEAIDAATQAGGYLLQRPPMHNLTDVMGHFETDLEGNFVLVKRTSAVNGEEVLVDALGRKVNQRGYLIDDAENIVNKFGELVVQRDELDTETGDIPADLFADLFIPRQISRALEDGIFKRKPRVQTGKQRPTPSLLQYEGSAQVLQSRGTTLGGVKASRKNIRTESQATLGQGINKSKVEQHQFDSQMYILQNDPSKSNLSQGERNNRLNSVSSQKTFNKSRSRHRPSSSKKNRQNSHTDEEGGDSSSIPRDKTFDQQNQQSPGKDLVDLDIQPAFDKEGRRVFSPAKGKKKHRKIQMSKKRRQAVSPKDLKKKPIILKQPREETAKEAKIAGSGVPRLSSKMRVSQKTIQSQEKNIEGGLSAVKIEPDIVNAENLTQQQMLDSMVRVLTQPHIPKKSMPPPRASSLQKRMQYHAPLPKRKNHNSDWQLGNDIFYRVNLDAQDSDWKKMTQSITQRPTSAVHSVLEGGPLIPVRATPGFLDISQSSQHYLDTSNREEMIESKRKERPFSSKVEHLDPNRSSAFNLSGRQIMHNDSTHPYANPSGVDFQRFYQGGLGDLISPASSLHHSQAFVLNEGSRRMQQPSVTSLHANRQPNKVSSAYRQDLTQMLKKQQASNNREDKQDDAFAQLKRIFNKR